MRTGGEAVRGEAGLGPAWERTGCETFQEAFEAFRVGDKKDLRTPGVGWCTSPLIALGIRHAGPPQGPAPTPARTYLGGTRQDLVVVTPDKNPDLVRAVRERPFDFERSVDADRLLRDPSKEQRDCTALVDPD